ncbi:MAG: hypothetical protein ABIQ35_01090 [Verrucomicrobiota bacterium]
MKISQGKSGRISNHAHGIGTITSEMVTQRAKELAIINGREKFSDADWLQAKRELSGQEDAEEKQPEEPLAGLTKWDENPGSSGDLVANSPSSDEESVAERLTHEGVEEANHDLMLKGSKRNASGN